MNNSTNGSGSLRPTWSRGSGSQGGRGFQPPPAVPAERRSRSGSYGSIGSDTKPSTNKFSALDDDDELNPAPAPATTVTSGKELDLPKPRPFRSGSFGERSPTSGKGRSLADLAARVPESVSRNSFRSQSTGSTSRFSLLRSETTESGAKITRYTREKLLALRPQPNENDPWPPKGMEHLEGTIVLSKDPLDPVCWDSFDADEIWAQARPSRSSSLLQKGTGGLSGLSEHGRRSSSGPGTGKWQRGVALPPPDEAARNNRHHEAEHPNDLWDDPLDASKAAADFSAFGTMPDDPKEGGSISSSHNNDSGSEAFDFNKMAEATQQFEQELRRGSKTSSTAESDGEDEGRVHIQSIDPSRPLASEGTTITSGSGEDVNVFEDFDETPPEAIPVKAADEDPSASSRLMKMIGVTKEETDLSATTKETETPEPAPSPPPEEPIGPSMNPWASSEPGIESKNSVEVSGISSIPTSTDVPQNPWGDSIVSSTSQSQQSSGFDLAARLEQAAAEQKARDEMQRLQSQEAEIRRRQQEEAQRRAMEEQARQQALRRQQQENGHSQVELVLMERISVILENSWGRAELLAILQTLHSEDSRVIPLLGSVDALRALIARHPSRVTLRADPAFGADMAHLLMTNAQYQQRQQEAQVRAQQKELERRQHQRLQALHGKNGDRPSVPKIILDAPWYYSDPQQNIQGPFRGEEMRQWLEAGYFKGDLPISQQSSGPFIPLGTIFPDLNTAFKTMNEVDDTAAIKAAEAEARRQRELRELEEQRRAAEAEARARAEAEAAAAAAAAERERLQQEAAATAAAAAERERLQKEAAEQAAAAKAAAQAEASKLAADQNEQSAQLKMLLGLGGGNSTKEKIAIETKETRKSITTISKNKQKPVQSQPSPPKPSGSAWGSTKASIAPRRSMSEIQQEEARASALLALERQAQGRASGSGWANIAAAGGGGTGWQSGAVKVPAPAMVASPANTRMIHNRVAPAAPKVANKPAQSQQPKLTQQQQTKPIDDFGASMSPALEVWCKEQMRKLNGSDDLTLVSFCMTLTDPSEIRQYLAAYLGSSPQVGNFATEFINKRGLGKAAEEEWESTKPKKGRKKSGK